MAAVLLAASVAVWIGGSATAGSTATKLQYTCNLPPLGGQPMMVELTWNAPSSVVVGQALPSTVNAAATVGPTVTWALGVAGAATVEGSVDAPGTVVGPDGTSSSAVKLIVPRTNVPASGPMTFHPTGTAPSLVFRQPGHVTINAGRDLTLHLTLRDSAANPAAAGNVDLSCTLDPGQNTVVFSFDVQPMPTAQPAATTATTRPVPAPTVTEPGTTATPPGRTSSTLPTTDSTTTSSPAQPVATTATSPPTTGVGTSNRVADIRHAGMSWWLAPAGILAAVAVVIGGVWWYTRRRRVLEH